MFVEGLNVCGNVWRRGNVCALSLALSLSHARYPPLFSPSQPKPRRRRRKRKRRRRRRWKWWVGKTTQLSWFIANNRIVVFFPCLILIFKDITIFCSCFDYYWRKQLYLQEQKNPTKSNRNHAEVAFLKWKQKDGCWYSGPSFLQLKLKHLLYFIIVKLFSCSEMCCSRCPPV